MFLLGVLITVGVITTTFVIIGIWLIRSSIRRESARHRAITRAAISKIYKTMAAEKEAALSEQEMRTQLQQSLMIPHQDRRLRVARDS
jgi:uncharacterized protein YneF (UPF0154 family)